METTKQNGHHADTANGERVIGLDRRHENFGQLLFRFCRVYWRTIVVILCPILLSPLLILTTAKSYRCLFTVAIMAIYWVTEALPLPVTAFIPVFFFPMLGVMSTSDTTTCYLNDTTMMFIASLFIAIAIEHSGLHMRIALLIIKTLGCSHRKLSFGIFLVTMLLSMWISNTAATAMIIPIVDNVLLELEAVRQLAHLQNTYSLLLPNRKDRVKPSAHQIQQGIAPMFIDDEENPERGDDGEPIKRPTNATMTYYLIAAYASTIGGTGTIVGTGTNLTFKGIFEARFPNSPGLNFSDWMCYAVPAMLICGFLIWLWLQVMFMGMFRPNSKDAKAINIGKDGENVATEVMAKKYRDLGPITWHQFCVAVLFVLVVFLWFFRKPGFVTGWPDYVTDVSVKDSTAAIFVVLMMFIIPSKLEFLNSFSKDPSKRSSIPSPGLLNWKVVQSKMHWGFLFVLSGGFALSTGIITSGLSEVIGDALSGLDYLHPVIILSIVCLLIEMVTELTSSVAISNIVLPIVAELAVSIEMHPLYLMLPATFCCSYAFHLPVGTPPNAIAAGSGSIKTQRFIIAGIGPTLITLIVLIAAWPTWGNFIFKLEEFPAWAES